MLNLGNRRVALLMVVIVFAVASCVRDTLKETNNGSAIDFRMATQTRASESTASDIVTFYVTAQMDGFEKNYFTDVPYIRGVNDVFLSSEPYYWPASGELNFYAYTPSLDSFGSDVQLEFDPDSRKIRNFVTASTFKDQIDFLVANQSASKADGAVGVELCFEHKLSQIEVHAKNANSAYRYSIKGVMIGGMASEGDFNFSPARGEEDWIIDEQAEPVSVYEIYDNVNEIGTFARNIMGVDGNAMLIPQQLTPWDPATGKGAYIAVYAQIKTAQGAMVYPRPTEGVVSEGYDWLVVPIDTKWEAGYKYVYTLDFSNGAGTDLNGVRVLGDKIHFSVDEILWNTTTTVQTTAADFVGTWEIVLCESFRTYKEGVEVDPNWPPYDRYDTDVELSHTSKVPSDMRRTRVLNENQVQIYPGIGNYWENTLGFKIQDGYLYITANVGGQIVENKYLVIDYSKDSFTMYSGEWKSDYYMEKIYYYQKVSDNEDGTIDGKWELVRGTLFNGAYYPNKYPSRFDISTVNPRLNSFEVENNTVKFDSVPEETAQLANMSFVLDSNTYEFTDVKTSTMLLKYYPYENDTSNVCYLYYKRID